MCSRKPYCAALKVVVHNGYRLIREGNSILLHCSNTIPYRKKFCNIQYSLNPKQWIRGGEGQCAKWV